MSEKEKDQWLMLGEICERKRLGDRFKAEAGGLFASGQDERAKDRRAIANELLLSAKQMREDYNEKYHPEITGKTPARVQPA